jgi:hypothetical protein
MDCLLSDPRGNAGAVFLLAAFGSVPAIDCVVGYRCGKSSQTFPGSRPRSEGLNPSPRSQWGRPSGDPRPCTERGLVSGRCWGRVGGVRRQGENCIGRLREWCYPASAPPGDLLPDRPPRRHEKTAPFRPTNRGRSNPHPLPPARRRRGTARPGGMFCPGGALSRGDFVRGLSLHPLGPVTRLRCREWSRRGTTIYQPRDAFATDGPKGPRTGRTTRATPCMAGAAPSAAAAARRPNSSRQVEK